VLKDEQRRAEYDQLWQHRNDPQFGRQQHAHEQSYSQQDFDDIFSSMFGQQAHQPPPACRRGHDLEIEVAVFLEETLAEQTRTISYKLPVYNVFGMVESETPKTLNVKIPAGVVDGQHPPERPGNAGRKRRTKRRPVAGYPYRPASAV
jgi:curved DNA-binding protein